MGYVTRKGTRVLHRNAVGLAIIAEVTHRADEYEVYRDFRVGDAAEPRFDAQAPDRLLVHAVDADAHPMLVDMAHALNLTTGQRALIPWNALAHTCKPADRKER